MLFWVIFKLYAGVLVSLWSLVEKPFQFLCLAIPVVSVDLVGQARDLFLAVALVLMQVGRATSTHMAASCGLETGSIRCGVHAAALHCVPLCLGPSQQDPLPHADQPWLFCPPPGCAERGVPSLHGHLHLILLFQTTGGEEASWHLCEACPCAIHACVGSQPIGH